MHMISDLHLKIDLDLDLKRYPSMRFCFVVPSFSDVHNVGLIFVRDEFIYPIYYYQNNI